MLTVVCNYCCKQRGRIAVITYKQRGTQLCYRTKRDVVITFVQQQYTVQNNMNVYIMKTGCKQMLVVSKCYQRLVI